MTNLWWTLVKMFIKLFTKMIATQFSYYLIPQLFPTPSYPISHHYKNEFSK